MLLSLRGVEATPAGKTPRYDDKASLQVGGLTRTDFPSSNRCALFESCGAFTDFHRHFQNLRYFFLLVRRGSVKVKVKVKSKLRSP